MVQDRICENCKVELSSDLSNCPLCGKHISQNLPKAKVNKRSFPIYSLKFVQTARWYNMIRAFFWLAAIICVVTNLYFKTTPYWFPYVLAGLVLLFHAFIEPIKSRVSSYIKNLIVICVLVAIFLIFVDAYNYYTLSTTFGWSLGLVAPCVMLAGVIATTLISLTSKIYEGELLRGITLIAIISIVYFIVKIVWFKNLATWPSLVLMCVSVGAVVLLEVVKRNKLIKELSKEFHI